MSTTTGLITVTTTAPVGQGIAPGTIQSLVSTNHRQNLDPALSPFHNMNYPGDPPWKIIVNQAGWTHLTDYCGSLFCKDYGAQGSIMQYGAAGHSAGGPCIWVRYDVATKTWSLVGKALPTNSLLGYTSGSNPPPTKFNHVWGDWIGDSPDWPAGQAQPGFNPPEGCHTRAGFAYRPASKAGNAQGEIITTWCPSGQNAGGPQQGSFIFDLDTGLWSRTATLKPTAHPMEASYHEASDMIFSVVWEFSHWADFIDVLDCSTMAWTRKYFTAGTHPYVLFDSTQFILGDLFVVALIELGSNAPEPIQFWACQVSAIISGVGLTWVKLNVSAPAWPVVQFYGSGAQPAVNARTNAWTPYPDGCLYCTNRGAEGHTLWKLTPPAGDTAAKLAGTWAISSQTLTGDAMRVSTTDYSRLQFSPDLGAFLYTGENTTDPVQIIKPL